MIRVQLQSHVQGAVSPAERAEIEPVQRLAQYRLSDQQKSHYCTRLRH